MTHKTSSIDFLQAVVREHADDVFAIDSQTDEHLSYRDFNLAVTKVSAQLLTAGFKKGDRVLVMMDNSLTLSVLYFGCLYAGLVVIPVNPILSTSQMAYILADGNPKLIAVSSNYAQQAVQLRADKDIRIWLVDKNMDNKHEGCETINPMKLSIKPSAKFDVDDNDELIMVYTSGTTADPKGVVHNLGSLVGNARLICDTLPAMKGGRYYNILQMTYLGGYYNLLLIPFVSGGSVVISGGFNAQTVLRFWEPVIKYKITVLWLVPTIMSMLLEMDRDEKGVEYSRRNIVLGLVGTAPLHLETKRAFEKKYGFSPVENFALSETLFITTEKPEDKNRKGSGKVIPPVKFIIADQTGRALPPEEEGEILVKTPFLMKGYSQGKGGSPELNLTETGWFATGDLGTLDKDGYLQVTGRKKDLIIRGGINISPAAIEKVLYRVSDILECAVVGLPHKFMGEEVIAVMRISDTADFAEVQKQAMQACKENLPSISCPAEILELAEFPHTSSGKIQKAKIRIWLANIKQEKSQKHPAHLSKNIDKHFFQPSRVVGSSIQATSIKYNTMVYELQREGKDVTVLSLGEAFFDIPLFPFNDLPFPAIYHYSHSRGIPELREKLAKYFLSEYEVSFNPESEIIVTAGSKIAIHMTLMSILDPGDEAIIHEPAWVSYPEQVKLCYGVPVQIPYHESVMDFEKYINNRTKVIIINSPNNPTGKVFSLEELSYLYKLAEKYNLFILSDEAYSDFLLNEDNFVSIGNLDHEKRHLILVNSISKNYGISGWRLGYVISNPALIDQILKVNQHLITCPATILECYIAKHFNEIIKITKPQIRAVVEKRKKVLKEMDKRGIKYLPGTATFYIFTSIEGAKMGSEKFCIRLLHEHLIAAVPGIGYGHSCDNFIRVSKGTESMERICHALDKIRELIDE